MKKLLMVILMVAIAICSLSLVACGDTTNTSNGGNDQQQEQVGGGNQDDSNSGDSNDSSSGDNNPDDGDQDDSSNSGDSNDSNSGDNNPDDGDQDDSSNSGDSNDSNSGDNNQDDDSNHTHSYGGITVINPTCAAQGYTIYTCKCGYNYIDDYTDAIGHDYADVIVPPTCEDYGYTLYTCNNCFERYEDNYVDPIGHNYSEVITLPTCVDFGYTTYSCNNCELWYKDNVTLPTHNYGDGVVTPPTCFKQGYTTFTCSDCDYSYEDNYVDPIGHNYSEVITLPTCVDFGYTTYSCNNCELWYKDNVTLPTHNYGDGVVTPPTCISQGFTSYTCSACGFVHEDDYTDTTGIHSYNDGVIVPPTCLSQGYTKYLCNNCDWGEKQDNYTDPTGHDYNGTVTRPSCQSGYTTYECKNCESSYIWDYTSPVHNYDEGVVMPATCTSQGYTTYTCSDCDYSYKCDYTDSTGHNYSQTVTQPTCTNYGYTTYTCSVCNYGYSDDYIDYLGHSFTNYISDGNADYYNDGTKTASCDNDGCLETWTITDEGSVLEGFIEFETLQVSQGNIVYGILPYSSSPKFHFPSEIETTGRVDYTVSKNSSGTPTIDKYVDLEIGDNVFYIHVETNKGTKTVYTVTLKVESRYTVSFNTFGGSYVSSQTVDEEKTATEPSQIPTRTGYTFDGWDFDFNTPITDNITINSIWIANKYAVYFDGNGAGNPTSQQVEFGSSYGTLPTVDNITGYTFDGWYTAKTGGTKIVETTTVSTANAHTLYAHWTANKYTLSFDGNGVTSPSDMQVTYDSAYGELPTITKTGYSLAWYNALTGGERVYASTIVKTASKHTLYARWTANEYSVRYVVNNSYRYKDVVFGEHFTIPTVTKTGYEFAGWYDGENGTGVQYTDENGNSVRVWDKAENYSNLYPKFTIIKTEITFDKNGGNGGTDSVTATYGSAMPTATAPSKTGYTFQGYYDGQNGTGTQYYFTSMESVNNWDKESTTTLYAYFVADYYNISYVLNGGINNSSNPSYYTIEDTVIFAAPVRNGYNFDGWYNGENIITKIDVGSMGAITIKAKWSLATYSIEYHLFDGENPAKNPTEYTILDDITLKDATKTGYTFNGWFTDSEFTQQIATITAMYGDLDLYAKFTANKYLVTFRSEDVDGKINLTLDLGSGSKKVYQMTIGSSFDLYSYTPTKTNYHLEGWYKDADFKERVSGEVALSCDTTYYAHWLSSLTHHADELIESNADIYGQFGNGTWYVPANVASVKYNISSYFGSLNAYERKSGYIRIYNFGSAYFREEYIVEVANDGYGPLTSYGKNGYITVNAGDIIVVGGAIDAYVEISRYNTLNITAKTTTVSAYVEYGQELPSYTILGADCIRERAGYEFVGWGHNGVWNIAGGGIVSANWKLINYSINYNLNGGENNINNPTSYTIEDNITLLVPRKDGYTFNGWFTDSGFINQITTIKNRTGNITLYAKFTVNTYQLTLNTGDGTYAPKIEFVSDGEVIKTEYLFENQTIDKFVPESKEGYLFGGWYLNEEYKTVFNFNQVISENTILYAKWIANSDDAIQIETQTNPISIAVNGKTEQYFVFVPMADTTVTFTSSSNLDLVGTLYNSIKTVLISADDINDNDLNFSLTYEVKAGKLYYIGIRGNTVSTIGNAELTVVTTGDCSISGTTYTQRNLTCVYGTEYALPDNAHKEGYTFIGWFDENDVKYESGVWNYTENVILYAKFE